MKRRRFAALLFTSTAAAVIPLPSVASATPTKASMDIAKRNQLIQQLSAQPEPQLVAIETFFDGNDDLGSIGCNLAEHPGMDAFRQTFARIARRHDVEAIYAQIAELDPGDDCWPFTDTVFVVGTIHPDELEAELSSLQPDEVSGVEASQVPDPLAGKHASPVLSAWWD